jgi:lipopolysaccharide transport system permease protein
MSSNKKKSLGLEFYSLLKQQRDLILEMTRRELTDRYAGQALGFLWIFVHPLILMGVYIFIFNFVFKVRLQSGLPMDYPVYLLSGLIPWLSFAESLGKSGAVMVSNSNLVKQVVFPLEILPVKSVLACLFTQVIFWFFLALYIVIRTGTLPVTYVFLPFLFLFQALAMTGLAYFFSALGVYFRDIKEFLQVFCVVNLYLMPVFYLPDMVPAAFRFILAYQDLCYFGSFKHPHAFAVFPVFSLIVFYAGYRLFRKLKTFFSSAL